MTEKKSQSAYSIEYVRNLYELNPTGQYIGLPLHEEFREQALKEVGIAETPTFEEESSESRTSYFQTTHENLIVDKTTLLDEEGKPSKVVWGIAKYDPSYIQDRLDRGIWKKTG